MARVFIVGCPRSGTTLLQAMLASHETVYSFPETHFFKKYPGEVLAISTFWSAHPEPLGGSSRELNKLF